MSDETPKTMRWKRLFIASAGITVGLVLGLALVLGGAVWYSTRPAKPRPWNPNAITAQFTDVYVQTGEHVTATFQYSLENHTDNDYHLPSDTSLYRALAGGKGLQRDKTLRWVDMSPVPVRQKINIGIEVTFEYTQAYPYAARENLEKLNVFMKRRLEEIDGFVALDQANRYEIRFPKPPAPAG